MASSVMALADLISTNGRLSAPELREKLKETRYEGFGCWITEGIYETDREGRMDLDEVRRAVREYLFKGEYEPDIYVRPRPQSAILAKRRLRPFSTGAQNVDAGIRLDAKELLRAGGLRRGRAGSPRETAYRGCGEEEDSEDVLALVDEDIEAEEREAETAENRLLDCRDQEQGGYGIEPTPYEEEGESRELEGFQKGNRPQTAPVRRPNSGPQGSLRSIDRLRSRVDRVQGSKAFDLPESFVLQTASFRRYRNETAVGKMMNAAEGQVEQVMRGLQQQKGEWSPRLSQQPKQDASGGPLKVVGGPPPTSPTGSGRSCAPSSPACGEK